MVSDSGLAGVHIPVHMRQVNERWLDAYRPWVYGAGFGVQIGCGLATYITSAAVYLTVVLAALTGDPLAALAVGAVFGAVRGTAVTLTARVTTPSALLAFHRRFESLRPWADRAVLGACLVAVAVLGVAAGPVALIVVAAVLVAAAAVRAGVGLRRRPTLGAPGTGVRNPAAPKETAGTAGSAETVGAARAASPTPSGPRPRDPSVPVG